MNENDKRIENAVNRLFTKDGLGLGKSNPISLKTTNDHAYRVTGMSQIYDIIKCGYIRPKKGKVKGGHIGEVFWSLGGDKLFYYDKRPVLEIPLDKINNGKIGAFSIDDLSAIYFFDEETLKYVDMLYHIKELHINKSNEENIEISIKKN